MTTSQKIQLIGTNLCPFVQRTLIALLAKKIPFEWITVDLTNKPEWFLKISPLAKVPALKINEKVLFESAVINEYLDEAHPPSLHPKDPWDKAQNRAWIEFGSHIIMSVHGMIISDQESMFNEKKQECEKKLKQLEEQIKGPFFNGNSFNLIDAAYAPIFVRLAAIGEIAPLNLFQQKPKISQWSEALLKHEAVQKSLPADFAALFKQYIQNKKGYLSSQI